MMKIAMRWGIHESVVCSRRSRQRMSLRSFSRSSVRLLRRYRPTFRIVHLVDIVIVSHQRDIERHDNRLFFRFLNNFLVSSGEKFPTEKYSRFFLKFSVCISFNALNVPQKNRFTFSFSSVNSKRGL